MATRQGTCELPGCNVRLAGRRRNTKYCTPKHRLEAFRLREADRSKPFNFQDPQDIYTAVTDWMAGLVWHCENGGPEAREWACEEAEDALDELESLLGDLEMDIEMARDEVKAASVEVNGLLEHKAKVDRALGGETS